MGGGTPISGAGVLISSANAQSINDLKGYTFNMGGSVVAPGAEFNSNFDQSVIGGTFTGGGKFKADSQDGICSKRVICTYSKVFIPLVAD